MTEGKGNGGPAGKPASNTAFSAAGIGMLLKKFGPIAMALIGSGFFGVWLSSLYSDRIAKREITAEVLKILSESILQTSSVPTNLADATNTELSTLLAQKQRAFLVRKMTSFLETNYQGIDFDDVLPALSSIETRYSFARIYEAAGMVQVVCENLSLYEPKRTWVILAPERSRCNEDQVRFLKGVKLELVDIDLENHKFIVKISNDHGNYLCHQRTRLKTDCRFSVDLTDRLENLPYEYMIITEFMGYIDPTGKTQPIVTFSVVKKTTDEDKDRSYWDYELDLARNGDVDKTCPDFFDVDESTPAKPPPPVLDNFDRMVLRACGPIRGSATGEEIKQLFSDYFDQLMTKLEPIPAHWRKQRKTDIINELHRIWTLYGGFAHVFCGDWDRGSIGGFHFGGRYLQLQMAGEACFMESPLEEIAANHVYTIGARSADGRNRHRIKGYSLNQSAIDLFALATRSFYAYLRNPEGWTLKHNDLWEKNVYVKVKEREMVVTYRVLAQAKAPDNPLTYGIKTIYPDLTPNEGYVEKTLAQ